MRLEDALSEAGPLELDFISRKLGLGRIDPNRSPEGLEIDKAAIRYAARENGIRNVETMMEAACDALGR